MKEKLTGYLRMIGKNQNFLANYLEISPTTLSHKINEKDNKVFNKNEMVAITELIKQKYPNVTMDEIFFN